MKNWRKAFVTASLVEVPLLILLLASRSHGQPHSALYDALIWYHVVPLALVSWCFLVLFGHGDPPFGGAWLWQTLYCLGVLLLQAALTSPIFFGIILLFQRVRARKRGVKT